jgi:hypothetical protein
MLKARAEAALGPLVPVVEGTVSDGRLRGSYQGYAVEACLMRQRPSPDVPNAETGGSMSSGPLVNIFGVKLAGVSGHHSWDCHSSPRGPYSLVPEVFTSVVHRLIRTEFKFERPSARWLRNKLGVPAADPALEETLRAAGLFEELSLLRWGSHPYLPKVNFDPHAQAIGEGPLADYETGLKEMLRAQSRPEHESALDQELGVARQQHPGELSVQVEAGKAKAPTQERFRKLLDVAVRVAQINAEVNVT